MSDPSPGRVPAGIADWNRLLRPYAAPATWASLMQLVTTLGLLFCSFGAMLMVDHHIGYWAALGLAPLPGLLLVRAFIIQHDCGHGSFFRRRWACDWVGRTLGVLTLTPYQWWKRDHDRHHASSSDLSRRGFGDIDTLTVDEYRGLSAWRRVGYRLYRQPVVMFAVGPLYQFLIRHRLPIGLAKGDGKSLISILTTNLAVAGLFALGGWFLGFGRFSALWLPVMAVAATVGVWMFYVQHQFETTYWARTDEWSFVAAALRGCSYYKLPRPLEWVTGSIGYHHIHHLSARVPNYRLKSCYRDIEALRTAATVTFRQSLACARLALWCERRQRLMSFRDALA
jgi:acyl-lipid omega-6 desaturase (Delta-12 desaturase)